MKLSDLSSPKLREVYSRVLLSDETVKDVRKRVTQHRNQAPMSRIPVRAKKQILVYYKGCLKDGTLKFVTPSGTTPGLFWNQRIKLLGLRKILRDKSLSDIEKVRKSLKGDITVHCDDPSFKYWGYQYIATASGYAIKRETRYPIIRNPKLRGGLCKHLEQVLKALPFHAGKIVQSYRKAGLL